MKQFIQAETLKTFHKSNFSKSWSTLLFFSMVVTTNSDTILVSCFDSIQSCSGYTDLYRAIQTYTELQTYKGLYRHTQSYTDLYKCIRSCSGYSEVLHNKFEPFNQICSNLAMIQPLLSISTDFFFGAYFHSVNFSLESF